MNIVGKLIIAIAILVILYTLYTWYFKGDASTTIISGPVVANTLPYKKNGYDLNNILTSQYSYSVWIYISDWSYRLGEQKIIFSRMDSNGRVGPELILGAVDNTITAMVDTNGGTASNGTSAPTYCQVTQCPIQTWVNIIVVLNQQALDVYIDGKLTRTCILGGTASMDPRSSMWVIPPSNFSGSTGGGQGGFDGFLSSFRAFPYPLNPRQAYEIYREGHVGVSMNLFNKYRVKLAFMKENQEMGSFEI